MKELLEKYTRKTRKWTDICVIAVVLAFLLITIGQLLGIAISNRMKKFISGGPAIEISLMYFEFIGIWIIMLPILCLKGNRSMLHFLAPNKKKLGNNWQGILWGIGAGFGMNAFCAIISILHKDIHLTFDCFEPLTLIMIFLCVLVQSGAEELCCRLYLLNKLTRRYKSTWFCILANSILFSALHLMNPGIKFWAIVQIVLCGILFSVMTLYYDSFYAACFTHTAWNFTQNIIFGLPNSGIVSPYSIFMLDTAANGPFFETEFGIEGSFGACLVMAAVTIFLIVRLRQRDQSPVDVWAERERKLLSEENKEAA